MTNFEKIKLMNKEQMTDFIFHALYDDICDYCENCSIPCNEDCLEDEEIIKKWLESEVNSNDT